MPRRDTLILDRIHRYYILIIAENMDRLRNKQKNPTDSIINMSEVFVCS